MKSTGITRNLDELGRIVLPIELRKTLDINIKDPLEIYVEGKMIILKKYVPGCVICGNMRDMIYFKDKQVCKECREK